MGTIIVEHIGFSNSFVDVILFVWLNRETKKELRSFVCRKKKLRDDKRRKDTVTKEEVLLDFDQERGVAYNSSPRSFQMRHFIIMESQLEEGSENGLNKKRL